MNYFKFREKITESVKDSKYFQNYKRSGEAYMDINKPNLKAVDKAIEALLKKNKKADIKITSFDGFDKKPKSIELYGDADFLSKLKKLLKRSDGVADGIYFAKDMVDLRK